MVISNFDREKALKTTIKLPETIVPGRKVSFTNILTKERISVDDIAQGIPVNVPAMDAWILEFNSKD